jgi:S-formylglutathione hydrolase FrmB
MRPWTTDLSGTLVHDEVSSEVLLGNPLGDTAVRPLWVYLPPVYHHEPERRFPVVYVLQGYTGSISAWASRSAFRPTYLELADELLATAGASPCLVVFVDAWTALGGSQFVDSPAVGRYHSYLCDEVVAHVDAHYRTLPGPAHRGVQGKSSGGFGAVITCMLRPDVFGAFASHAGDALYEYCYLGELATAYRALRDEYDRSYEAFLSDFRSRPAMSKRSDFSLITVYAMAACFSADEDGTVRIPFDAMTGALDEEVWRRWLDWDPVRMVERYADGLRGLRGAWLDAGRNDDYRLDLGAEVLAAALRRIGVDVRLELFDGTHSGIEYRYPLSLGYLATCLAGP